MHLANVSFVKNVIYSKHRQQFWSSGNTFKKYIKHKISKGCFSHIFHSPLTDSIYVLQHQSVDSLFVNSWKPSFLVDWRLLIKDCVDNIG